MNWERIAELRHEISTLESENAKLRAENIELRAALDAVTYQPRPEDTDLLTVRQVSTLVDIPSHWIHGHITKIPHFRIGSRIRISRMALDGIRKYISEVTSTRKSTKQKAVWRKRHESGTKTP